MGHHQVFTGSFRAALLCLCALALGCPRRNERAVEAEVKPTPPSDIAPKVAPPTPRSIDPREFAGARAEASAHDAIVIAGERFSIGAPVILWSDPDGYSAYETKPHFDTEPRADAPTGLRYLPGRKRDGVTIEQPTLVELQEVIDQFVIHFDVCGVSRQCFKILQDRRGLSVHFMLDIDGTLYQTLDLRETAWHARQANPRSVGIEIANMGGYAPGHTKDLDSWYAQDEQGWRIQIPASLGDGGVRTEGFIGRPARPERIQGVIQGDTFEQFDFTPQQYDTLVKLAAVLCRVLPRIEPDLPRDAQGSVRTDALSPEEFEDFHGILGHLHVTREKNDPGPAMDWENFLERVRARL